MKAILLFSLVFLSGITLANAHADTGEFSGYLPELNYVMQNSQHADGEECRTLVETINDEQIEYSICQKSRPSFDSKSFINTISANLFNIGDTVKTTYSSTDYDNSTFHSYTIFVIQGTVDFIDLTDVHFLTNGPDGEFGFNLDGEKYIPGQCYRMLMTLNPIIDMGRPAVSFHDFCIREVPVTPSYSDETIQQLERKITELDTAISSIQNTLGQITRHIDQILAKIITINDSPIQSNNDSRIIYGVLFEDANNNNIFDSSEMTYYGVEVSLHNEELDLPYSVTTDINGAFVFTDLDVGLHTVYLNFSGENIHLFVNIEEDSPRTVIADFGLFLSPMQNGEQNESPTSK